MTFLTHISIGLFLSDLQFSNTSCLSILYVVREFSSSLACLLTFIMVCFGDWNSPLWCSEHISFFPLWLDLCVLPRDLFPPPGPEDTSLHHLQALLLPFAFRALCHLEWMLIISRREAYKIIFPPMRLLSLHHLKKKKSILFLNILSCRFFQISDVCISKGPLLGSIPAFLFCPLGLHVPHSLN